MTAGRPPSASPSGSSKRRLHPALKLSLALLALVLALFAAELLFRLCWTLPPWFAEFQQAGMYVAAGDADVALMPGYRGALVIDERRTVVAINALGMRGREVAEKRDERRLLVLGDSMVFGYGVDVEQALPHQLELSLQAAWGPTIVGSGGVPGYGSRHMAAHLQRLDPVFAPDVVLLCGCLGNDALDDTSPQRTVYAGLMLEGPFARLAQVSWRARLMYRSRAALWVESFLWANHESLSLARQLPFLPAEQALRAGLPPGGTFAGLFLDVIDDQKTWQAGTPPLLPRLSGLLRESLMAAKRQCGARPLVFVILPTSYHVLEPRRLARLAELKGQLGDQDQFERGLAQRRWHAVAAELGILSLDATPILAAEEAPESLFLNDGAHFSERGHRVVAGWLAREIAALKR